MTERTARRPKPSYYLSGDGRVVTRRPTSRLTRLLRVFMAVLVLGIVAGGCAVAAAALQQGRTPREWAAFLRQQSFGGSPWAGKVALRVAASLAAADNLGPAEDLLIPGSIGAAPARSGDTPGGRFRKVTSVDELRAAAASAQTGDVIILAPGLYRVSGRPIQFATAATRQGPITVRALKLGDAVIESEVFEAFNVSGAYWRFENLVMRGVCPDHSDCEHAIHIAGAAAYTTVRNNRLEDFNAQLKINGDSGHWPDDGLVEGNTLINTAPRRTRNPVTPIDLVGASNWDVRNNLVADFVRGVTGEATYGAFFKGAGENNLFERNIVLCRWKLRDPAGPTVGLSLGGGGTGEAFRRDRGKIGLEQVGGVIRDNLIAFCSSAGIYLNRAAHSRITHNTLIDTAGIEGRYLETSGDVTANIIDGVVQVRDGATLTRWDNDEAPLLKLFLGRHPQRAYFRDPARLDMAWVKPPENLPPDADDRGTDLCGHTRGLMTRVGAFDDYGACLRDDAKP